MLGLMLLCGPQRQTSTSHSGMRCLGHRGGAGLEGGLGVLGA